MTGEETVQAWLIGPFRRAYITGPMIFIFNLGMALWPILNSFFGFLLGYWAVADYYDYDYDLFKDGLITIE